MGLKDARNSFRTPLAGSFLLDGLGGTLICNLLTLFCGVLSGVTLARSLGPVGRGELATAFLWPNVLMLFGDLGLGFAFSYFVARERDKVSELWSLALCAAVLLGGGLALLGAVALPKLLPTLPAAASSAMQLVLAAVPDRKSVM